MAIFGRKKKTEEVVEEVKAPKAATKTAKKTVAKKVSKKETEKEVKTEVAKVDSPKEETKNVKSDLSYRITEKATRLSDKSVYVLNVPKNINKISLKKDLEKKYKVTVLSINIVNSPKKTKIYKGRLGVRGGGKKAYITLKAGESIVL